MHMPISMCIGIIMVLIFRMVLLLPSVPSEII